MISLFFSSFSDRERSGPGNPERSQILPSVDFYPMMER